MRCPSCNAENDTAAPSCAACGHRLPPRPIGTGSLIASRYEILGSLGAGGMGLVFKARDRALDETVALKVLRASASRDPGLAQRFRSEIKLAWKVRHRNVCGIHEYGEDGDLLYISMELVEGKDLRHTLRENGPLTWGDAYDVATQIAEGLLAIHQAGVIHRDLKPANLMRDAQGLVRLMDFGIAKVWGEESGPGVTATGHVVGSPEYMSPEQVRGKSIDFRSDLYALGLVIYEIFTGRIPFQADTPAASMLRRLEEDASLEGSDAALIPRALVPVLRRALARDPDERFATCSELLEALRAARAALPNQITDQVPPLAQDPTPPRVAPAPLSQAAAAEPSLTAFPASAQAQLLVPQLSKALAHADRAVRLGAAQALGRVGAGAQPAIPG
jgi:serine/threonine protein kinase